MLLGSTSAATRQPWKHVKKQKQKKKQIHGEGGRERSGRPIWQKQGKADRGCCFSSTVAPLLQAFGRMEMKY